MSLFFMMNPKAISAVGGHFLPDGVGEPQVIPTESEVRAKLEKKLPKELVEEIIAAPEEIIEKKIEVAVDSSPSMADIKVQATAVDSRALASLIEELENRIEAFGLLLDQERLVREALAREVETAELERKRVVADTHAKLLLLELEFLQELKIKRDKVEDEELFLLLVQTQF